MEKINLNKKIFLATFIFILFLFANKTQALSIPGELTEIEEQVSVNLEPKNPKPNQDVKITLEAFGTDLTRAFITWIIDDSIAKEEQGATSFTIKGKPLGSKTTINIRIIPRDGPKIEKNITIFPQSIDLVWETDTSIPPFYKGKALFTPQSQVSFVAVPDFRDKEGSKIDGSNITYVWKKDGTIVQNQSGYGKDEFTFKGTILMKPVDVFIEAKSAEGFVGKDNLIGFPPVQNEVFLYEQTPLLGILFNKALGTDFGFGSADERTIVSIPFYFDNNGSINRKWTINGKTINVPSTQKSVVFRNSNNQEGKSTISISITNANNFLQQAKSVMTIDFEKLKENVIF